MCYFQTKMCMVTRYLFQGFWTQTIVALLTMCGCMTAPQTAGLTIENTRVFSVTIDRAICGFDSWHYVGRVGGGKTKTFDLEPGCWHFRAKGVDGDVQSPDWKIYNGETMTWQI